MNQFLHATNLTHWGLYDLKHFDDGTGLVVDGAVVQLAEQPWLGWGKIDTFHAVRARQELFLSDLGYRI